MSLDFGNCLYIGSRISLLCGLATCIHNNDNVTPSLKGHPRHIQSSQYITTTKAVCVYNPPYLIRNSVREARDALPNSQWGLIFYMPLTLCKPIFNIKKTQF